MAGLEPAGDHPAEALMQSNVAQVATGVALPADLRKRPGQRLDILGGQRATEQHADLVEPGGLSGGPPGQEAVLDVDAGARLLAAEPSTSDCR